MLPAGQCVYPLIQTMRLVTLCVIIFSTISSIGQNKVKQIDNLLDSIFPNNQPGIAIAILQRGETAFSKGYGVNNIITQNKITPFTNFNIASLTKQFTAAGIIYLQEKGLLNIDQTIDHYFPDMNKAVSEKITTRHLLTHSSGIIDH